MARLAIVGGGASGLIAAYFLKDRFDVTVFERDGILGGNVRTLNRNVATGTIGNGHAIEAGVLGFNQQASPTLHRLLEELGAPVRVRESSTSLYRDSEFFAARQAEMLKLQVVARLACNAGYRRNVLRLRKDYAEPFKRFTDWSGDEDVPARDLFGPNPVLNDFTKGLLSLAYSTPFDETEVLPASLASPYLQSLHQLDWSYVRDGVYSYLETIVSRGGFRTVLNSGDVKARRCARGVEVNAGGQTFAADALLLAVTPGQVLSVLNDADSDERRVFSRWADRTIETLVHTDTSFYAPFSRTRKTPMDLFVSHQGGPNGYNAHLNEFCGLDSTTSYSFAFGLEDRISSDRILHRQTHTVPVYGVDSVATQDEIRQSNGRNRTYFAGAWLCNGLHEGAALSASRAAERLKADFAQERGGGRHRP